MRILNMPNIPTERGAICRMSRSEYVRNARELDRNFSVAEFGPDGVVLRLDFPGAGLADGFSPEFLRQVQCYFDAVLSSPSRVQPSRHTIVAIGALALVAVLLTATPAH
jgi:hypothetical protein